MARLVITSPADGDAAHMIADLGAKAGAKAGANVADRYDAALDRLYERLTDYPKSGALRPPLGMHIRICVVSPYVVIYEHIEADDTVVIMRIVHGRRKITRKFLRGKKATVQGPGAQLPDAHQRHVAELRRSAPKGGLIPFSRPREKVARGPG